MKEPEHRTTDPGATVTFTVEAQSFITVRYQWQKLGESAWEDIPGATAAALTLPDVSLKEVGQYRVIVRNNIGAKISEVAALRFRGEPKLLRPPQNQSVSLGPEIEFSVFANGTPPFSYQWSRNGEPIASATADRLVVKTEQFSPTQLKFDIGGLQTLEVAINDQRLATGGVFTVEVHNALGQVTSPPATLEVDTTFTKITDDPILEVRDFRGAWADYDGDGDLDVFNALSDPRLFHNDGHGHFTPVPNTGLPVGDVNSRGGSWGDYDNDGHPDLYLFNLGGNALYRNQGNGTFTRVPAAGVEGRPEESRAATWVDYDKDGNLDLFVANGTLVKSELNFLYRNRGDGTFERVTAGTIANEPSGSSGAAWADYDEDGNLDLFVANEFGNNENDFLYRNNVDGTFQKVISGPVVNDGRPSNSASWGDFDNDGLLDLFVRAGSESLLYRSLGGGEFVSVLEGPVGPDVGGGAGVWGDYDNDGNLDLFVALGLPWRGNVLYHNNGDGTFARILSGSPNNDLGCAEPSPCWIDIDNDGHLDLFVGNLGGGPSFLYHNNGNSNHWLRVKCQAKVSNRDASGTRIRVRATIRGQTKWQLREVTGGDGRRDVRSVEGHFGLGDATNVETLRLEWPSGVVQELKEIAVDQILPVPEPERPVKIEPAFAAVRVGETAVFTARTDWSGPLSYQWQKYGQDMPMPGETNATLRIENVQATDYGRFFVLVGRAGTTERVGALVALQKPAPPVILWQPRRPAVELGGEARFEVQATGTAPLSYQWQTNGVEIPGATDPVLVISQFQDKDAGVYVVLVRNQFGETNSQPVRIGVPEIEGQPATQSVSLGASAAFAVDAVGFGPLSYQWQRDGKYVPGATNASVTLSKVTGADNGSKFRVRVVNRLGQEITSREAKLEVDLTFRKITHNPIVEDSGGAVWGDYYNDGNLDVFLTRSSGWSDPLDNHLYRNNGDGTFTPVTEGQIVHDGGVSINGAAGDYNNDGNLDLFVVNFQDRGSDLLYQNQGDGSFMRVATFLPPGTRDLFLPVRASWIDYDNDGWLDLYVICYGGEKGALYRNQGDGAFLEVIDSPLVAEGTFSNGIAWADIDDDGYLDLFVPSASLGGAPGFKPSRLFKSNRDGTFTRIFDSPLVKDEADKFDAEWADYDNDGKPDLFVGNTAGPNFLYHNYGNGKFTRITEGPIVTDAQQGTMGGTWGDYDNDGNLDLFVPHGLWNSETNALYHNEGDGRFTKVTSGSLVNELNRAWQAIWVDYDNDGFLDLYLGIAPDAPPPSQKLFQNNLRALGNTNGWIKIKLVGTDANRSGIGAKLRVKATIRGKEVWQLRQMVGGTAGGNTSTLVAHFGLGDAKVIDELVIEWPGPKFTRQVLHNVAVNQTLTVVEPAGAVDRPSLRARLVGGAQLEIVLTGKGGATYALEASTDLRTWTTVTQLAIPAGGTSATFTEPSLSRFAHRFYRAVER